MQISKGDAFYKATEFCATMWDTFRGRRPWNAKCVTQRLPQGLMDICTVGRVFLFTGLYFVAWALLLWFCIQWAFVQPLVGIANLNAGMTQLINIITGILILVSLGVGAVFLARYFKTLSIKSPLVELNEREQLKRSKPKKVKKPNLFWQAIVLRYKAFKEKTCIFLELKDDSPTEKL